MSTVLVTGGSGFIGSHVIAQLLTAGHQVRTTVRNLKRETDVRAMLKVAGVDPGANLTFAAADLEKDAGWAEAVAGCEFVQHVASPFPIQSPKDENELIVPAREGTLRVLKAARDAGVKRVVVTSSFAAIGYGHRGDKTLDETSWTDVNAPEARAYVKSKTIAERAAWDFVAREGGTLELSVVNPVGVFGPTLGPDISSSVGLIKSMLDGTLPGMPRLYFGVVDVRDVADMHLRCMTNPAAKGERFLAVAGKSVSFFEMGQMLRARLGPAAARVAKSETPDLLIRFAALFNPLAREAATQLGNRREASNEKARRVLGWSPRSNEEAIVSAGESLVRLGLLNGAAKAA